MDSTRHTEREYGRPLDALAWPSRVRVAACWAWRRHRAATLICAAIAVIWTAAIIAVLTSPRH